MKKTLEWLSKNPTIDLFLAIAFYLAVVVFHDDVTRIAIKLRRSLSLSGYNLIFTMITVILFLTWTILLVRSSRSSPRSRAFFYYYLPTLLLIAIFFIFMQTYSIEAVHFFQYALLAFLLFPLLKSYGATVFWTTLLGVFDEIHQYLILTPDFDYFDFNDNLLNLLGAGIAMVSIYMVTGIQFPLPKRRAGVKTVLAVTLVISSLFLVAYLAGYFRWYPIVSGDLQPVFIINRTPPAGSFFTEAYKGRYFHIMNQWEGIILGLVLFGYYFSLDRLKAEIHFPLK